MPTDDIQIVRSDDPRCGELEATGYRVVGESWGARLRLSDTPDLSTLESAVTRAETAGIVVQELGADFAEAVHELESANNADYPFTPATAHDLLDRDATVALWTSGARIFGALYGIRLVAVTAISLVDTAADLDFASVFAAYRGRGIGAAVTAVGIIAIAATGVRVFGTGGAAVNAASLGTVRSLGFVIEEQWRSYQRP